MLFEYAEGICDDCRNVYDWGDDDPTHGLYLMIDCYENHVERCPYCDNILDVFDTTEIRWGILKAEGYEEI